MAKQAIEGASRLNAFLIEPERLVIIEDPKHALYDERVKLPLDEKLVLNVAAYGVKQPIIVTKDGDHLVVVDGRQRARAAVEASKRLVKEGKEPLRVPVMLQRGEDADLFGVSVFLNELRQSDDIIVKAKKAQRLLDMGKSEAEVALAFGVTSAAIRQWLKMFDLAPAVRKAVEDGTISASAAAKLAALPKEEQVGELTKLRATGAKTTTKKVAVAAKKAKGKEAHERPTPKLIKRLIEFSKIDSATNGLDNEDVKLLRWVLGEIDAKAAGIASILQEMEEAEIEGEKKATAAG